jgi:hypothetical protein
MPISNTSFSDAPAPGSWTYMVRAIKLEQSGGGTYYNASQGIFGTATASVPALTLSITRSAPDTVDVLVSGMSSQAIVVESSTNLLQWTPILTNALEGGSFNLWSSIGRNAVFFRSRSNP